MKTRSYTSYLFLLIIFAGYACNKSDNAPDSGGTMLSRIVGYGYFQSSGGVNDTTNTFFTYTSSGQLVSRITVGKQLHDTILFTYNTQNQLAETRESNSSAGAVLRYRFIYDVQGRVSRRTGIPLLANLAINDHTYAYDAGNRVIADSIHNGSSNDVFFVSVYEYEDGNIGKAATYNKINGSFTEDSTAVLYYDKRTNPYYANRSVFYFALDDIQPLSANNQLPPLSSRDYYSTYEYYSNGLLRSAIVEKTKGGDRFVTNYFYTR